MNDTYEIRWGRDGHVLTSPVGYPVDAGNIGHVT